MTGRRHAFSADVSKLNLSGQISNKKSSRRNMLTDEVDIKFNMFCLSMEDRIDNQVCGRDIITVDDD